MKKGTCCYLLIVVMWGTSICSGADWNQFRGPNRDGKSTETALLKEWPEGGPALLWSCEGLKEGYASVSVVDGIIYTTGMNEENQGCLFAIDNKGKLQWKKEYGPEWTGSYPGTRTTPTVDEDRIYVISGLGRLSCFSLKTKELVWKVDTLEKFQGKNITWGISESVLIDGDKVICTPGGQQATIVALNKHTGETIWATKELSNLSAYCSPIIVNHGDKRLLLTMVEKLFVCIDSQSGKLIWKIPHEIPYDIAPSSPVYEKGYVYFTGQIRGGRKFIRYVNIDDVNKWISLGRFEIVAPFGVESLQLIASSKDLIDRLPSCGYDNETQLYVVSRDPSKAVLNTRAIKKKISKKVKSAEAVLLFTTMKKYNLGNILAL